MTKYFKRKITEKAKNSIRVDKHQPNVAYLLGKRSKFNEASQYFNTTGR